MPLGIDKMARLDRTEHAALAAAVEAVDAPCYIFSSKRLGTAASTANSRLALCYSGASPCCGGASPLALLHAAEDSRLHSRQPSLSML